ncbi:hypothetical protein GCM10017559_78900 [Streptosporangium longisporum]|uniref:Uncharacterized protein n=1 Tax=Streptosporangium longisporum TaxID=46187 RepID=A0ABP6LBX0_9ACTN
MEIPAARARQDRAEDEPEDQARDDHDENAQPHDGCLSEDVPLALWKCGLPHRSAAFSHLRRNARGLILIDQGIRPARSGRTRPFGASMTRVIRHTFL